MTTFRLFDSVQLKEAVSLSEDGEAPAGTPGSIVEILHNDDEAYLVELFGDWVTLDAHGNFVSSKQDDPDAFRETLGVETVYPHQLRLIQSASETIGARAQLLRMTEELPEELLAEVVDFAEFLQEKRHRRNTSTTS